MSAERRSDPIIDALTGVPGVQAFLFEPRHQDTLSVFSRKDRLKIALALTQDANGEAKVTKFVPLLDSEDTTTVTYDYLEQHASDIIYRCRDLAYNPDAPDRVRENYHSSHSLNTY